MKVSELIIKLQEFVDNDQDYEVGVYVESNETLDSIIDYENEGPYDINTIEIYTSKADQKRRIDINI